MKVWMGIEPEMLGRRIGITGVYASEVDCPSTRCGPFDVIGCEVETSALRARAEKAEAELARLREGIGAIVDDDWQERSILLGPRIASAILIRIAALMGHLHE